MWNFSWPPGEMHKIAAQGNPSRMGRVDVPGHPRRPPVQTAPAHSQTAGRVEAAWAKFTAARKLKQQAIKIVDDALAALSGAGDEELELETRQAAAIDLSAQEDRLGKDAVSD
jgi:hypothetical protein